MKHIDERRSNAILIITSILYDNTGIIMKSQTDLSSSYLFPYRQPIPAISCKSNLDFITNINNREISFQGMTETPKKIYLISTEVHQRSYKDDTSRLEHPFLLGLDKQLELCDEFRTMYSVEILSADKTYAEIIDKMPIYQEKTFPNRPFVHNLPHSNKELMQYIQWIKEFIGVKQLLDPWGNPFHFFLKKDMLYCCSNGPDGIQNTKDDISYYVDINKPGMDIIGDSYTCPL